MAFLITEVQQTGSTNSDLLHAPLVTDKAPQGHDKRSSTVPTHFNALLAWEQSAGRGRRGHHWHSIPGQSLTFSLSIDFSQTQQRFAGLDGLSLWAGLCSLDAVVGLDSLGKANSDESLPVLPELIRSGLRLKWPNDLVVLTTSGLKKVGGLLVESRSQGPLTRVVIGVGINVFGPVTQSTAGLEAASLWESMCSAPDPQTVVRALAQAIATQIQLRWSSFAATGFAPCVESFNQRHVLHDQVVSWEPVGIQSVGPTRVQGVCCGVSDRGGLLVRPRHHQDSLITELNSVEARVQLELPIHKSPSNIS